MAGSRRRRNRYDSDIPQSRSRHAGTLYRLDTERLEGIFADRAVQQRKTREQIEEDSIAAEGIRRLGQPEDVAALAVFLCSPAARHIHGTGISCDGGGAKGYY